jgi:hypothetical protein
LQRTDPREKTSLARRADPPPELAASIPFTVRAPGAQTERRGFADRVKLLLGGEAHRPVFLIQFANHKGREEHEERAAGFLCALCALRG